MGDVLTLLDRLNLSPINTILLSLLLFGLKSLYGRIERGEAIATKHSASIAFIKGRLGVEEEE